MKVRFTVGTYGPICILADGLPSVGDEIVLPEGSHPMAESHVFVVSTLHPRWEADEDGVLVPTVEVAPKPR